MSDRGHAGAHGGHAHDHGHAHAHVHLTDRTDARRLTVALALIVGFIVFALFTPLLKMMQTLSHH